MTVSVLLVTHEALGSQLLSIAQTICCQPIGAIDQVAVPANVAPQDLGKHADNIRDSMTALDQGGGVLVLTDVFGATPDNLARYFAEQCNARVVSGLNLPMLLRVLHYPGQTLQQLCDTAISGARSGIQANGIERGDA
jgi:PTS system ascorbate-specific IIA component